jgi:hypothetical protein
MVLEGAVACRLSSHCFLISCQALDSYLLRRPPTPNGSSSWDFFFLIEGQTNLEHLHLLFPCACMLHAVQGTIFFSDWRRASYHIAFAPFGMNEWHCFREVRVRQPNCFRLFSLVPLLHKTRVAKCQLSSSNWPCCIASRNRRETVHISPPPACYVNDRAKYCFIQWIALFVQWNLK